LGQKRQFFAIFSAKIFLKSKHRSLEIGSREIKILIPRPKKVTSLILNCIFLQKSDDDTNPKLYFPFIGKGQPWVKTSLNLQTEKNEQDSFLQ
jgi:hypothetical protein